jgi:hypothetical protein
VTCAIVVVLPSVLFAGRAARVCAWLVLVSGQASMSNPDKAHQQN